MKILVTGVTGQLGFDVIRAGKRLGFDMIATSTNGGQHVKMDITNDKEVVSTIQAHKPDVIIHCAAYTAVDNAEDDRETCWKVNVEGTKHLANAAKQVGAKFVYISTDYVFDGKGETPFSESQQPNPIGQYGISKYEGEKLVLDTLDEHFIIRISWVFGINGNNFVKTMLKLAESRDELNVVGDQIGSPTYTLDLANRMMDMIQTDKYGIYHVTNEGFCSWSTFADEIFKLTNKNVKVNAITSEEYPTKAVRPKNSRMSKQKLVDNGFKPLRSWQGALEHYINELKN